MNEAETRAELINPALKKAGWSVVDGSRVRLEYHITIGRLVGRGKRGKRDVADYVLLYRDRLLGVIEAKKREAGPTEGLGQAKAYAARLQARFAFSTNGDRIYRVDMETGSEGYIERYPTPGELWEATFGENVSQEGIWRERFAGVPFDDKGGQWTPRYYQHNAIANTVDAIASGKDRILLTLATGTGKTAIAFQIAWKLFHSRWNLTDWREGLRPGEEPSRRPRILFLADRNNLADQAFNAFSSFPEDALTRITPTEIRKKGGVPKNASVFFTIFQTFSTGRDDAGNRMPNYTEYPADFFDFIVIDECHRGGANDESSWRDIMTHFSPAVQLGLTATPKRTQNVDTYAYFGEPVYVYSLKEGINDGFLTPFKVRQFATTIDEYVYTSDDDVLTGEIEEGRRYVEKDFNRIIEIEARERKRVELFMSEIDQRQKTLVFCANQAHAASVRDMINQIKTSTHPDYCVRVTANDGDRGEEFLKTFRDNEKTIPTILTTSQKLSTGVDAKNVRNIVLLRPVNSIIEFKQIIGRGTRLFEGKDYFTIYDFVKAHENFNDPEWDGEPEEPVTTTPKPQGGYPDPEPSAIISEPGPGPSRPRKIRVKLSDGKERSIMHMASTSFWSPDGRPMSAEEFIRSLFGELPKLFRDEDELREIWSLPSTRGGLLESLADHGFSIDQLSELGRLIDAPESDLFDVLSYVAFETHPISRRLRAEASRELIRPHYSEQQREFIDFVIGHYVQYGVGELDQEKIVPLVGLKYRSMIDAEDRLGTMVQIRDTFIGFQKYLYGIGAAS